MIQDFIKLQEQIKKAAGDAPYVLGVGDVKSALMLIGEAPGKNEIELQAPFVGKAGKHLDRFMEILGISRPDLYITNTVKIRPQRLSSKTGKSINRPPNREEQRRFIPLLREEIRIIAPQIIVTLGNVPLRAVMADENLNISHIHGKKQRTPSGILLMPLYHPAYVIYNRAIEPIYLADLQKLKCLIHERI